MRVLALDYGRARCGCAVSDPTGVLASPIEPVRAPRSRRGLARLHTLVRELGAERVVVGLPVSLSGRDTAQTVETREFAAQLARELPVPVELYDERLTTRLAVRTGNTRRSRVMAVEAATRCSPAMLTKAVPAPVRAWP